MSTEPLTLSEFRATVQSFTTCEQGLEAAALFCDFYTAGTNRSSPPIFSGACEDISFAVNAARFLATRTEGIEVWVGDRLLCSVPPK